MATQTAATGNDTVLADWQDWHRQQEARLADPHGFLAVTGLHWLTATPRRFSDAPGNWSTGTDGGTVVLDEDEEEELVIDGTVRRGTNRLGIIAEREGIEAVWGEAVIEVAKRGGHDIVRPRHPDNPLRTGFCGTPAYAANRVLQLPPPDADRNGDPGLQPGRQSALRLHRSGDLPAPSGGEPAPGRDRSGREDPLRAQPTR
jgi:hypothetical protein